MIDNMMIIDPPKEMQNLDEERNSKANILDLSELDIDYLKSYYKHRPDLVWVNEITHVPRETRGTKPCFRATSGGLAYEGGKLYPCAVGSGVRTNNFIIPTENWREEIKTIYPKCSDCYFANV